MNVTPSTLRRRLGTAARISLRVAVGLLVVGGVLYVFRDALFGRMLRTRLEAELSSAIGAPVTIGAVEGGWITDLTLLDVRTVDGDATGAGPPRGALRRLSIARAQVEYGFPAVLSDPLAALRAVGATGFDVELDPTAPRAPDAAAPTPPRPWTDVLDDVLPNVPSGTVQGRVVLAVPGMPPDEWNVTVLADGRRVEVTAQGAAGWTLHGVTERDAATAARTVRIDLMSARGLATLRAGRDATSVQATGLDIATVPAWVRAVAGVPGDAAPTAGTVTATIHLPGAGASSQGSPALVRAWIDARDLAWRGRTIDRLEAEGEGAGTSWTLARLRAEVPSGTVETHALRIDTSLRVPVVAAGRTDVRTADLAALVGFVGGPDPPRQLPAGVGVTLAVASFEGGVATIDELAVSFRGTRAAAAGTVTVPADAARADDVVVALRLRADAALADARTLFPDDDLPEAQGTVHVEGDVAGRLGDPSFRGTVAGASLVVGGTALTTVAFEGTAGSSRIDATRLRVAGTALDVDARGGIDLGTRAITAFACDVVVRDLAAVGEMIPGAPPLAGSGEAHVVADGLVPTVAGLRDSEWRTALRALTFRTTAKFSGVRVDDEALGDGTFAAVLAWPRLAVPDASFTSPDAALRVRAAVADLDLRTGHVEEATVSAADVARLRRWIAVPAGLSGSLEIRARADKVSGDGWKGLSGTASLAVGAAVWRGTSYGDLSATLAWQDGAGTFDARAKGRWGDAAAGGTATFEDGGVVAGTFRTAAFHGERGDVVLTGPAAFRVGGDRVALTGAEADVFGGRLCGDVATDGERLDADLVFEGVDLAALSEDAAGRASGRVAVHGPPERPEISLAADIQGAGWRGLTEGRVGIVAEQRGGSVELRTLDADFGVALTLHAEARLPWMLGDGGFVVGEAGDAHLIAKARIADGARVSAAFPELGVVFSAGDVDIAARGTTLQARAMLTGVRWSARPRDLGALSATTVLTVDADRSRTTLSLETGPGAAAKLHGNVVLGAGVDWTRPRATWDAVRAAPLSGSVTAEVSDLAPLRALIPGAAELHGRVDARLDVSGTTLNPKARGRVAADGVAVRFNGDLPPVTDGVLVMTFDGRDAVLQSLRARLGFGDVAASGTLATGGAQGPVIDLRVTGANALLTRGQYLRLRSDLDLHATGPVEAIVLTGDVRITDAVWSQPVSVGAAATPQPGDTFMVFALEDEPFKSARLDVHVVADRTIHAENDLLHGTLSADLRLRGTGGRPEPEGTVVVEEGRVTLPFTELRVVHGEITFPRGRPFVPRIDAAARSRIRGIDTTVRVSGEVASASVHVFTDPPLSRQEAMLLVSTGATPTELEREGVSGVAFSRARTLLGEELVTLFSGPRNPSEESALDRFRVEVGNEVSRSGADTVDARFAITERFFLRGQRDRYDAYDLGFLWRFEFR